jgi:Ca-activated chloride channel family protein
VAKVFALGDRIRFIYEGVLIEISDEGIQTLDELLDALNKQ